MLGCRSVEELQTRVNEWLEEGKGGSGIQQPNDSEDQNELIYV